MRENGLIILFNTVFIHVYDFVLLEGMEQ